MAIVQPTPPMPVIVGDTLACEGGSFLLTTQSEHQSYEWIDPQGNSTITDNDTLLIPIADMSHSGAWVVIASDHGCASDTSAAFIMQIDTALVVTINTTNQVCEGDSITLTTSPSIPGVYTWSGPGGFTSLEPSPTTLAEDGSYAVFLTSTTGCDATDTTDVQVDVLPVILSLETDADSCVDGTGELIIWAVTSPGFSTDFQYQWDGPSGFTAQDSAIIIDSATAAINGL
jgi:hypothetical protein